MYLRKLLTNGNFHYPDNKEPALITAIRSSRENNLTDIELYRIVLNSQLFKVNFESFTRQSLHSP